MVAGFVILRILILWLLYKVTHASGLTAANAGYEVWSEGGQKRDVLENRRPLHYIRFLRKPKNSPDYGNPLNAWRNPQRSFVKALSPGQNIRQTASHLWPKISPVQTLPQRNDPLVQPRGFKVSLDLPFYKQSESKESEPTNRDNEQNVPKLQTKQIVPFQRGVGGYAFQIPERESKKEPYFVKNLHGFSPLNFKVNLEAAPVKPIKIISTVENNDPVNVFQTSYMEPGKLTSFIRPELNSPVIQSASEQTKNVGLTWSNYPDTRPKQPVQRPYDITYTRPTNDKLTSTWPLNQYNTPEQRTHENPPAHPRLTLQSPDLIKLQSLPIVKYVENLGLKTLTSLQRKDNDKVQPSLTQTQPLYYNTGSESQKYVGSPSNLWTQNGYSTGVDLVKDLTSDQKSEKDQDAIVHSLQLGPSFPLQTFLSNPSRNDEKYLNIKPQNVGTLLNHYLEATKPHLSSSQTVLGFDHARHWATNGFPERKWPILNVDIAPEKKKPPPYVPVTAKSTDGKPSFFAWFPSTQVGQEEISMKKSLRSEIGKPQLPIQTVSKYLDLVDVTRPLTTQKYHTIQAKPFQSERVQSFHSSLNPNINGYVQNRPSVGVSASTRDMSPFKPSSDFQRNVEMAHSSSRPLLTYAPSSFNSPKSEALPAEKPQTWQKPVPSFHRYSSEKETTYDRTFEGVPALQSMPSGYQTQDRQNEKGHYRKPFDADSGGNVFGQTYQTGKNTAGTSVNVQPQCGSSSSTQGYQGSFTDLQYPYLNTEPQPCSQVPCMDGSGKCSKEPGMQSSNFPQRASYSPTAETISISIPFSTFEKVFTQSSPKPDQIRFMLQQYPVG